MEEAGRGGPRTPFMKRIIEDVEKATYEEPKVPVEDRDEWIEVIEPIWGS